ncbi:beta-1,3-galactosyltransferase 1-like isoform X2 [Homarus americanus]|uniref:beta-1,3-galactosyltransferase 1-like isoform X2 n=1 Tax=Homarus americanus TaxID=6706 RepID=UPI001C4561F6|nr:beta-1,3-galactosyltransferase 1-like isoform X2 [Homarus americanus]
MLVSPSVYPKQLYLYNDDTDIDREDQPMVNLRIGRMVQRSYVCRRCGCIQPVVIALLLISAFIFLFFQMVNMLPRKPVPPPFAWPSNATRDLTIYIKPNRPTVLLQPSNFCSQPPFLLFVVPSAINDTKQRETIRITWGQWTNHAVSRKLYVEEKSLRKNNGNKIHRPYISDMKVTTPMESKLVFLLGMARGGNPISNAVQEESRIYGDIVVEEFVDSYTNLTLKSVFMLKWVHNNCPGAKFVMKVDDDIFLNVPNLQRTLLNKTITKIPHLTGTLICGARPIHDQWSKWYSPKYMFREGKYPNYLSGTGYVFSGDLVKPLLDAALSTPYFHLEDVFITGICARKVGVHPKDNLGFSFYPRAVSPCVYKEAILGHGVKPSEMVKLWNMLNQPKTVARCNGEKKSKYLRKDLTTCSKR